MTRIVVPSHVRAQIKEIVKAFNEREIDDPECYYVVRFREQYVFLAQDGLGGPYQICRLTYTGDMNRWEFAIYRHIKDRYDPGVGPFPGSEHLDGTIEGAMRAGIEAYPC
ncbi:MAG: hypothetical protein JXB30_06740 [Anaerolineae bacterium]|nr:hypothetical protein [Anaerolineae bacterium]